MRTRGFGMRQALLRGVSVLGVATAVGGIAATAALAQSSLNGEILACNAGAVAPEVCVFGGTPPAITALSCPANGPGSFGYAVTDAALGPYPGSFTESGTVRSGSLAPFSPGLMVGRIETVSITFRIESPNGVVVGRKRLTQPSSGPVSIGVGVFSPFTCVNGTGAAAGLVPPSDADKLCYVARLPDGTIDAGTSTLLLGANTPAAPSPPSVSFEGEFLETFVSNPAGGTCGLLPTTAAECKRDGWSTFVVFKNQGDCVAWVETRGRNAPG